MLRTLGSVTVIVFAACAAVGLILTGLVGFQPARWSLDPSSWRHGIWTGRVIPWHVALGAALLLAASALTVRVVRRLGLRFYRRRH
jgi:hypothetical protein